MKTKPTLALCVAALCGLALALHAQTPPLTPSGPPSDPTTAMKSLNQLEPRTIIPSLPYTISQPGSYYLTGNLTLSTADVPGITVQANDVTIDLNGFTLTCTSVANNLAIETVNNVTGLVVRNGTIRGVRGDTSNPGAGGFSGGIAMVVHGRLEDLLITRVQYTPVWADHSLVSNVIVSYCGGADSNPGMFRVDNCVVENCISENNADPGSTVVNAGTGLTPPTGGLNYDGIFRNCIARNNTAQGFLGQFCQFENCSAINNGTGGFVSPSSTFINCVARFNTGRGIDSDQGVVTDCRAWYNTTDGSRALDGRVSASIAKASGGTLGIQADSVSDCMVVGFDQAISAAGVVRDCKAENIQTSPGISGQVVSNCQVGTNVWGAAISAAVVSQCAVTGPTSPTPTISATIKRDCVVNGTVVNDP